MLALVLVLALGQQGGVPLRGSGGASAPSVLPPDMRYAPFDITPNRRCTWAEWAGAPSVYQPVQTTGTLTGAFARTSTTKFQQSTVAYHSTSSTTASAVSFRAPYAYWAWGWPGAGGFAFWTRWGKATTDNNTTRVFIGGRTTTGSALTCAAWPLAFDALWFGCNDGDSNVNACSANDAGVTCVSLGANFPCGRTSAPVLYDTTFAAAQNASVINYYAENLDTGATTSGTLTQNLPAKTSLLNWEMAACNGDAGTQTIGYVATCVTQP